MAFRLLSRGSSRRRRRGPRRKSTSMSGFRGSVRLSEAPLITSKMASLSTLPSRSIKLWNEHSVARSLHEHDLELQDDADREAADHLSSDTQDRIAAGRERFFPQNARLRPEKRRVGKRGV